MATASAVSNVFSVPGALMKENFADVLDARFAFVKRRTWNQPIQGLDYWMQRDTNKDTERHSYVTHSGIVPKSRDVDRMPIGKIIQGFDNSYTPEGYRMEIRVERRLRETDLYNVIDRRMEDLNRSGRDTIELSAALPFNTAFATTVEWTCADGMNLVDSARPYEDPSKGTWSNEETASALTQGSVGTMRLNFRKNKNELGLIRPITMKDLVIPSDLEDTAITELGSAQKPGSSLNDKNYLTEYNLSYKVWEYLTSTTAYFGMGPKDSLYELFWYWGSRPSTMSYLVDSNPDVWASRLRMVYVTGCDRPSAIRGNAGA